MACIPQGNNKIDHAHRIVDLRNAVRKELGFGPLDISEEDRQKAWIAYLPMYDKDTEN